MGDIEQIRDITRQRWGRITAFRLGMVAAEFLGAAADDVCPYQPHQHAYGNFFDGVANGLRAAQPTTKERT